MHAHNRLLSAALVLGAMQLGGAAFLPTGEAFAHVEAKGVNGEPVTFRDSGCTTPADPSM